jgi:hypothetical protein
VSEAPGALDVNRSAGFAGAILGEAWEGAVETPSQLNRSATLDDSNEHDRDGDHQQDVDEAVESVGADDTQEPQDEQHYENGPQHGQLLFRSRFAAGK